MYQVHSCILGTQDEHKTIFYGTRALVHRSKVWATAKIPLAVWQPATFAFLYVCMSSIPPSLFKRKGKKRPIAS